MPVVYIIRIEKSATVEVVKFFHSHPGLLLLSIMLI